MVSPLVARTALRAVLRALGWLVLATVLGLAVFLTSSARTTVAGHDAEVRPTIDGWVTVRTGAVLPDARVPADGRIGVELVLGKTRVGSVEELLDRYALLAADPDAQVDRVSDAVRALARDSALRGAAAATVALGFWVLLGRSRWRELVHPARGHRRGVAVGVALALLVGLLAWQPWRPDEERFVDDDDWTGLADYLGPDVAVPEELASAQMTRGSLTDATRRLLLSGLDSYRFAQGFYARAAEAAGDLELRQPGPDETVALLVSDRHDNVGMDRVARAIGDAAGITAVLDAGDDTSTGQEWEAFSLDSLAATYEDLDRWAVAGNHDHGGFVRRHLERQGWTVASEEVVDGPGGSALLAFDDPRSSGLGRWRDAKEGTVAGRAQAVAEVACASERRVGTLLVHDEDLGTEALERGCVDLVVAGHVHVASGPDRVVAEDGTVGWTHTAGTAGGAAYAIAVGSKLRRAAAVSLVTYAEGRPVGVQVVTLETTGEFRVGPFAPLTYGSPARR
jgi:hypothetical protein